MDFFITTTSEYTDDNGVLQIDELTRNFTADLSGGEVLTVYELFSDNTTQLIINQPFNFSSDGKRVPWNSIDEGVEWAKTYLKRNM